MFLLFLFHYECFARLARCHVDIPRILLTRLIILYGSQKQFRVQKVWSKLLKCLYGLKISPRQWYDTYSGFLLKNGWSIKPAEPGVFTKGDMCISLYVDDSLLTGPVEKDLE